MHPLTGKITSLQQRLIWRDRAAAACRFAATAIGAALLLGLIDYVVRFTDPGLRILATTALAAAAAWAAYRWLYRPTRRKLLPLHVARRVEARFPQLHDSLASAIEFLQQSEDDHSAGSAQLRRIVVSEAETAVDQLPLDDVIDPRPLRRAAAWLAVPLVAVALCLAIDPHAVATALSRLIIPIGSAQWPRQNHLAFREVPERLVVGQTFEVELIDTAGRLPDDVRIEYRDAHSARSAPASEPMARAADTMVARRENVRKSFSVRATGGDDDTMPWRHVEVIEPPRLELLEITIHPPAYTGLPPSPAERHLQVLAGTGIELRGIVDRPIAAARILLEGGEPIVASLGSDSAGNERRTFQVAPSQWVAAKSGPYRLELADKEALTATVGKWNLRVDSDPPPSISWQRPNDDLYVTPTAIVPIALAVNDNLAVQRVDLVYERSDRSEAERERQPTEPKIELYRGPQPPLTIASGSTGRNGDSRVIVYQWDLESLELPVGAQLTIYAEATDYRPGTSRTVAPRNINIITAEELEARLADRMVQIVRQLERALTIQRTTREYVRRLEIQQQELHLADANALQSAELNQRRVDRMLADPIEGASVLAEAIAAEVEMNRIASSDLQDLANRLAAEIARLASGPLAVAQQGLASLRKAPSVAASKGEALASTDEGLPSLLRSLASAQDDVLETLERLINDLSGDADYRRFIRLLAELRNDQLAHQQSARAEIGLATLPLRVNELTRAQRTTLNQAAAAQASLAARFEKIEQSMDDLSHQLADEESDAAGTLADAVTLARQLAVGSKMQQTALDFGENRVGQALERGSQIADDLQQLLNILRRQQERQPQQLVDKLRAAEKRLAELRRQLGALREEIAQAKRQPAPSAGGSQVAQLQRRQQALRSDIERLARQLERLQAPKAGQSTQRAAARLSVEQPSFERPASDQQVEQAEEELAEAVRQLAARRQQAEDDLALELVRRFQHELSEMVEQQKHVVDDTVSVHDQRATHSTDEASRHAADLAQAERRLAEQAREHGELLFGLGAVRISLEEAQRRLIVAAELLDQHDTGRATQQAERHALDLLEAMLQAFAQTADEASRQQQQPGANAGPGGEQPPRRPTFELLEVKMLRMLQADLNERTAAYRRRRADQPRAPDERQRTDLNREARELAAEQGRLAELVQDMLARDNEQ